MDRLRLELVDYIYGEMLEDYRDEFISNKEVLHGGSLENTLEEDGSIIERYWIEN